MLLNLTVALTWNRIPSSPVTVCSLSKQGHRLLSSLDAAAGDTTTSHRLIQKFVASSSKFVALNALSHLLSSDIHHYSSLALPLYESITEAPWFNWNPKLVCNVIASLENQGRSDVAEALISESFQRLASRERDLALFYCNLIDSYSKCGSKQGVFYSYARLKKLLSGFSSPCSSLHRQAFESMINGLSVLDLPSDAEEMMEQMRIEGFKPSDFEFRSVVLGYGRLGLFSEMRRVIDRMESSGCNLDTISSNIVLSSYGTHGELAEMVSWIQKMKNSNIPYSIRTYNSVLNSCPTIMSLLQEPKALPLSMEELIDKLQGDEALLVKELVMGGGSTVLVENLQWGSTEVKLDLHGMHLGTAYVIMLQWMEELRSRFEEGKTLIPAEIKVVCGLGKHSNVMGKSPVKALVSEMMVRSRSPMRIGKKSDNGCFVGRGKAVRDWLVLSNQSDSTLI